MDDFVFLLPRPVWQPDEQSLFCNRCHALFSFLLRKHHCRHCGLVYCDPCCSRKTHLRQLGYLEQVKVCEGCFEQAYLISYILNYESKTTQLHGARGLYEILIKHEDDQLKSLIQHGGFETFIFLSQRTFSPDIHLLSMMALRYLFENGELLAFFSENDFIQRHERTFSVLVKSITAILEGYLLVPEAKDVELGVQSVRRIIFNAVLTGSRLVLLLTSYPYLIEQMLKSRWLYLFLDAFEQAFNDCGYKLSPKSLNAESLQPPSKAIVRPYSKIFSIPSVCSLSGDNKSPDDLWVDDLELQVVASEALCALCSSALKENLIPFNHFEVKSRTLQLISRYPDPKEPEVFHFQLNLTKIIENLNHTLETLNELSAHND